MLSYTDLFARGQWKRRSYSSKKRRKIWPSRSYQELENLLPSSPWLTSKSFLASNLLLGLQIVPLCLISGSENNDLTVVLGLCSWHSMSLSSLMSSSKLGIILPPKLKTGHSLSDLMIEWYRNQQNTLALDDFEQSGRGTYAFVKVQEALC